MGTVSFSAWSSECNKPSWETAGPAIAGNHAVEFYYTLSRVRHRYVRYALRLS